MIQKIKEIIKYNKIIDRKKDKNLEVLLDITTLIVVLVFTLLMLITNGVVLNTTPENFGICIVTTIFITLVVDLPIILFVVYSLMYKYIRVVCYKLRYGNNFFNGISN